ncbi:hypothetical protein BKA69DRAFT_1122818 [Paraphysoderma sedebokerense]|nr:hypothetical protein BKA69DRAFT_1122818 [Paraphysoderma sedebokerense]
MAEQEVFNSQCRHDSPSVDQSRLPSLSSQRTSIPTPIRLLIESWPCSKNWSHLTRLLKKNDEMGEEHYETIWSQPTEEHPIAPAFAKNFWVLNMTAEKPYLIIRFEHHHLETKIPIGKIMDQSYSLTFNPEAFLKRIVDGKRLTGDWWSKLDSN